MPATTKTHQLQLVRTMNAAPNEVYAAWIDPVAVKAFWVPQPGFTVRHVEMDVRVGGHYRIEMLAPTGTVYVAVGVYKEVIPGKKLVYTWIPEGGSCAPDGSKLDIGDTLVTMEFRPKGTGTELTFTHERFSNEAACNDHKNGWTSILEHLATHVS